MDNEIIHDTPISATFARRRRYWIFGGTSIAVIALLGIAYWQRTTIADRYVRDQLKKYGVQASYKITDIGLRTQRLENVVIGDPKNPDLTIKNAEIDLSINFTGATLRDVRAAGVRIKGSYDGEKFTFGQLDKFRDLKSTKPFEIPDIALKLSDAGAIIQTPWGLVTAGLDGNGLLRQKFAGNLSLRAPVFMYAGCIMQKGRFDGRYVYDFRRPNLMGPLTAESLSCANSGIDIAAPLIQGNVRLSEKFERWYGDVSFSAATAQSNTIALSRPRGAVQFDGSRKRTNFEARLNGGGYTGVPMKVRNVELSALGHAEVTNSGIGITARGDAAVNESILDGSYLSGVNALAAKGKDTPVGPLLARIAPALRNAAANFDASLKYDGNIQPDSNASVVISGLRLRSRSGERIEQSGVLQLKGNGKGWALVSSVNLALAGAGLPSATLAIRRAPGSAWAGELAINEYRAGAASLAVPKMVFARQPSGNWKFDGRAILTGPLQGGYVTNLSLPIDARWDGRRSIAIYQSCQTIAFDGIKYANAIVVKQALRICPNDRTSIFQFNGGAPRISAIIPNLNFNGSYGGQGIKAKSGNINFNSSQGFVASNIDAEYGNAPIRVRTPRLRFNFGKGFASDQVRLEIGRTKSQSIFDIANVEGRFDRGGLSGILNNAKGTIANVPLILSDANGGWNYRDGILALNGALKVSDAEQVDRFLPMDVPDAAIILRNGLITAAGNLTEPITKRKLSSVDIRHMLSSGIGGAVLKVSDLKFDDKLQPDKITPLVVGVFANARGNINGAGFINWGPGGVKSNGKFTTESLDVDAAFGSVERLKTQIEFTDLLALETGSGQVADIGSVNPGIAALDGKIRYQLLPGKKVGIEGGTWPFAGGKLILEPTVIDFAVDAERRLTFRVVGIDAAKFLQQYDFQNLQVSGVFDGTLPMIFNQEGGRIVGGTLKSRSGGGEVSYVGDLSYENMGVFANFAFNALRSIQYKDLMVGINGDLGGEIITEVSFAGVQQGEGAKRNFITKQLAKLPIQFNVRISAQFLQLIGSIRGIYDSKYASERYVPMVIDRQLTTQPIKPKQESKP